MSFGASSFLFSFFVIRSAMTGRFDKLSDREVEPPPDRSLWFDKLTNRSKRPLLPTYPQTNSGR